MKTKPIKKTEEINVPEKKDVLSSFVCMKELLRCMEDSVK
jgi:hypothetical protein